CRQTGELCGRRFAAVRGRAVDDDGSTAALAGDAHLASAYSLVRDRVLGGTVTARDVHSLALTTMWTLPGESHTTASFTMDGRFRQSALRRRRRRSLPNFAQTLHGPSPTGGLEFARGCEGRSPPRLSRRGSR